MSLGVGVSSVYGIGAKCSEAWACVLRRPGIRGIAGVVPETANAFSSPAFVRYTIGRLCAILGQQGLSVVVGWQVYAITGRAFDLGIVGLLHFLPQLLLFPVTGVVADRLPRHVVLTVCNAAFAVAAAMLALGAESGVGTIYTLVVVLAVARAFAAPAAPALVPQLVPPGALVHALSWNSATFSVGGVVGPALAGGVYALSGSAGVTFGFSAVLMVAATVAMATVRPIRDVERKGEPPGVKTALDGLRFIFATPVLLAAISLDLFAVLFGGAVALLPIYAADILKTGPWGLGLLRAAPSVGAMLTALWLTRHPIIRRVGPTMLATVAGFGLATLLFALSTTIPVALCALALVGATDAVSVYIRQNIVQLATPDHMRGRVSAAQFVFIGASNELGEMESGLAASWLGPVGAAVSGGVGTLVVVLVTTIVAPALRRMDSYDDVRTKDPHTSPPAR